MQWPIIVSNLVRYDAAKASRVALPAMPEEPLGD